MSNQQHRNGRRKYVFTCCLQKSETESVADRQVKIGLINQTIGNLFMEKSRGPDKRRKTPFGCEPVLQLLVAENHGQKLINLYTTGNNSYRL